MNNEVLDQASWHLIASAFERALELMPERRQTYLAELARQSPQIAERVGRMLHADASFETQHPSLTELPIALALDPELSPGTRLGPYEVELCIGAGGMGRVYRAHRINGDVDQTVAIKCLRFATVDDHFLLRFQREQKILARLSHAHIARFLDVGCTENGSPYVVMEYVEGDTIVAAAIRNNLPIEARLSILLKVMDAVAYLHAKLIVHRDIKAGNVLLTATQEPKLLDFGIAKVLTPVEGANAVFAETALELRAFSLANAAPEQLRGESAGTSCDIYALGTLLYELLCDQPYLELAGLPFSEARTRILEQRPEAPSRRRSADSTRTNRSRASARQRALRGDLDRIVLHALSKHPDDRYATVESFASDLRNHLDRRPISIRRDQLWYAARRFAQRNRLATGALGALIMTILVAAIGVTWQARATEQRARELEDVASFQTKLLVEVDQKNSARALSDEVLRQVDQRLMAATLSDSERTEQLATFKLVWNQVNGVDAVRSVIDRAILEPAERAITEQFATQPKVDAALRNAVGRAYAALSKSERAVPLLQRALALRENHLGESHPETVGSRGDLAWVLISMGEFKQAEIMLRSNLDMTIATYGKEHAETTYATNNLGYVIARQGRYREALPYYRQSLALRRRNLGDQHLDTANAMNSLAVLLTHLNELEEAIEPSAAAMQIRKKELGDDNRLTLQTANSHAMLLQLKGSFAEAEALYREVLQRQSRLYGEESEDVLVTSNNLANLLAAQGRLGEAESMLHRLLTLPARLHGRENAEGIRTMNFLGMVLRQQHRLEAAEKYSVESLRSARRTLPPSHPQLLVAIHNLGRLRHEQKQFSEAEALYAEALNGRRSTLGDEHPLTLMSITRLGTLLVDTGRYVEALALLQPAEAARRRTATGDNALALGLYLSAMGRTQSAMGRYEPGEATLLEAYRLVSNGEGATPAEVRIATQALADLYQRWTDQTGRPEIAAKASDWHSKLGTFDKSTPGGNPPTQVPTPL